MHESHLSGAYEAMGRQYARHLAADGRTLAGASPEPLDPPAERLALARESRDHLAAHAPFLLDELRGIAAETGRDLDAVAAVPLALDACAGCSLVGVRGTATASGAPLVGRNHDFHPSFREYATLYRTDPADGFASVGCSGVYVGRCDGVNEAGLAVGFAGVLPHEFEPGLPWHLALRATLDTCETVDEAVGYLGTLPHATNVNLLLADATGDLAVVEASPDEVRTTRPDGEFLAVSNQFHTDGMRAHQSTDRTPADCGRIGTVRRWYADHEEQVGVEDLKGAMGDPDRGMCWRVDEAADDPRSTIWSWVLSPAERAGHLARDSPVDTPYERVSVPGIEHDG